MKYYLTILEVTTDDPKTVNGSIESEPNADLLMKTNTTVDLKIKVMNGLIQAKLMKFFISIKYAIAMILKKTNVIKYGIIIYDEPTAKKVLNLEK